MMDIKASFERRVASMQEELPASLQRDVKVMGDRDLHRWKDSDSKFMQFSEIVQQMREQMKSRL
jgi:hypothetical protein